MSQSAYWGHMPYIPEEQRFTVDGAVNEILKQLDRHAPDSVPGIVNYVFTRILKARFCHNYRSFAMGIGVLVTCGLEFYRRWAAPYEDVAIRRNGDVQ